MTEPEILSFKDIIQTVSNAMVSETVATMSYLCSGKWKTCEVSFADVSSDQIDIEVISGVNCVSDLKTDQPVGINFAFEHHKFIFETKIAVINSQTGNISLEAPEKVEKLLRRSYIRVSVPKSLAVKVMFWHRGHNDSKDFIPTEDHWQGRLSDLSAGGMLMYIPTEKQPCFDIGQLVGLQFTPMPYEKPILLEGLVRHIESSDSQTLCLGLQFLGLEASWEGRQKLRKLVGVVSEYDAASRTDKSNPSEKQPYED